MEPEEHLADDVERALDDAPAGTCRGRRGSCCLLALAAVDWQGYTTP